MTPEQNKKIREAAEKLKKEIKEAAKNSKTSKNGSVNIAAGDDYIPYQAGNITIKNHYYS